MEMYHENIGVYVFGGLLCLLFNKYVQNQRVIKDKKVLVTHTNKKG